MWCGKCIGLEDAVGEADKGLEGFLRRESGAVERCGGRQPISQSLFEGQNAAKVAKVHHVGDHPIGLPQRPLRRLPPDQPGRQRFEHGLSRWGEPVARAPRLENAPIASPPCRPNPADRSALPTSASPSSNWKRSFSRQR